MYCIFGNFLYCSSMHVKQSDSVDKIAISLLDVYPVGAIYMSTSSTDPGSIFGGTWEA